MAILFFLLGILGAVGAITYWSESTGDETAKVSLILTLAIALLVIPFLGNTSHIEKHVVLRTDSFQDVTYNKVVRIEYDVPKTDHWWTWKVLSLGEMENVEVFFEEE